MQVAARVAAAMAACKSGIWISADGRTFERISVRIRDASSMFRDLNL